MAEGDFPKSDGDILFASEVNKIKANLISFPVLNKIRQQQDRSVDISSNKEDIFSDAYIDSNGRVSARKTQPRISNFKEIFLSLFYRIKGN